MSNVGYGTLQIIPSARGFGSALQKETSAPLVAGGKTGGKAFGGGMLAGLKGFAGPLAAIFGAQALYGFAKSAIGEASDLNESVNAVRVSYGKAAKGVLDLGKNSATSFGLSKAEFNDFAVRFSAFSTTIAGKGGNVAKTLGSITGRATDFASVMNLDVAEAAQIFQSGLAGETEPLRRFGIDLSAAKVEAYAYANGIAKTGEELTESQKVQARYGSLMEQTKKVQGDFRNTSDELANSQRILSARWKNAKAQLATGLLPIAGKFVGLLNKGLGPAMKFVSDLFSGGFGGGSGGALGSTMKAVQTFAAPLVVTLKDLGSQIMAVVRPALAQISSLVKGQVLPAFREFLPAVQPVANFLLKVLGGAVVGVLKGLVKVVKGVLKTIAGVFEVFTGLLTGDWSKMWSGIKKIASGVLDVVKGAIQVWWNGSILALFKKGAAFLLKGIWTKLWSGLKSAGSKGMNAIKGAISSAWGSIKGTFSNAVNAVKNFVSNGFTKAKNIVSSSMTFTRNKISGAWTAIRSLFSNAVSAVVTRVRTGFTNIVSAAKNKIGEVVSTVRGLPGKAMGALSGIGSKLTSAGANLMRGFISGVKSMASSLIASVTQPISDAVGKAKSLLGIKSPSRVFMEIGAFTAEGMALGMTKNAKRVSKAAEALAYVPDVRAPGVSGGGTIGARAAGGRPVQITIPGDPDPLLTARRVARHLSIQRA